MNRTALIVAVALAAFAAGAVAQDAVKWIGAVPSHRSVEKYDMSVGVTAGQLPRRSVRFEEDREVLEVPSHYGVLAGVTSDGTTTVFWFKDAENSLRNAVVVNAGERTLKLQYAPSSRYEADLRDQPR